MAGFKIPDFAERTASARDAKQRALDKLRAKPALDPEVVAAKQAALAAKEAAAADKRATKQAEIAAAKAEREAARLAREEAANKPAVRLPTAEEMKAARDARYAARKARTR